MKIQRAENVYTQLGSGAIQRKVGDKALEIPSVLDLGAIGNGVNDDAAAIQEAVDNHPFLIFPRTSAFYKCTTDIQIPSGRTLLALGATLKLTASSSVGGLLTSFGQTDIRIEGFVLECDTGIVGENGIGFARELSGSTLAERIWIVNCTVRGFKNSGTPNFSGGTGITVEVGAKDVHIIGNTVEDCDNGMWIAGNQTYLLRNVQVIGNTIRDITNAASDTNMYTGNGIVLADAPTGGGAVAPTTFDGTWVVQGNTIDGALVAFRVLYASRFAITNNAARNISTYGYFVQEGHYGTFANNIVGGAMTNYVRFASETAIEATDHGSMHHIVSQNQFLGSASSHGMVNIGSSLSRGLLTFNKMQSVSGSRYTGFGTGSVIVDQDDGALTGLTDFSNNGITVPTGTFTPAIGGSTSAGTVTYSAQLGRYTKIGNRVLYDIYISVSAVSVAPTGNLRITGLPFTVSGSALSATPVSVHSSMNLSAGYTELGVVPIQAQTYIEFFESGDNVPAQQVSAAALGTALIRVSGHYEI